MPSSSGHRGSDVGDRNGLARESHYTDERIAEYVELQEVGFDSLDDGFGGSHNLAA